MARDVKFTEVEDYGTFATRKVTKYNREKKETYEVTQELKVKFGTWGDPEKCDSKFDIRPWNSDGTCEKGIILTESETEALYELLKKISENND